MRLAAQLRALERAENLYYVDLVFLGVVFDSADVEACLCSFVVCFLFVFDRVAGAELGGMISTSTQDRLRDFDKATSDPHFVDFVGVLQGASASPRVFWRAAGH